MRDKNNDLLYFMLNPDNYPQRPQRVLHIETHISHVFIADKTVYKIKKPVNFGFLDFTTLAKRRFYCHREVELNSRLAKNLYKGVVPIYITDDGYSFIRKKGSTIAEYAVVMKYIPENLILYNKIQQGDLLCREIENVGKYIARFHKKIPAKITKESIYKNTLFSCEENFTQIGPYKGITINNDSFDIIAKYTRDFLQNYRAEFLKRKRDGFIKEIHGDLHSQHICLTKPPTIFDCIEFNNRFRIDDVLNDLAFLLMDLEFNGRHDLSSLLKKSYEKAYMEAINNDFLKFYKVYRAVVRGKVEGFISQNYSEGEEKNRVMKKAKDYFQLAQFYIENKKEFNPVIFFGLSGTGKSSLAKEFSDKYLILRSDEIRKEIVGLEKKKHEYVKFEEGIYSKEITKKTYEYMIDRMVNEAKSGKLVILDATFIKNWQREAVINACESHNLNPLFILCICPLEILKERVKIRKDRGDDISDAHEEILLKQAEEFEKPVTITSFRLMKIDTSVVKENIIYMLKEFL